MSPATSDLGSRARRNLKNSSYSRCAPDQHAVINYGCMSICLVCSIGLRCRLSAMSDCCRLS